MSQNNKTYMQENMLLQLHEQYAVNNNAKLESAVTLIVGLLAVIGAYGYVFLHTSVNIGENEFLNIKADFTILSLILTATAATIVLAILIYICMYQGFAQRKGQFIIYAIRCKYDLNIKSVDGNRIFPDNYHPFNKKDIEMYQGMFGEFIKISNVVQFIILVSTSIIFAICDYYNSENLWLIFIFIAIFGICWCVNRCQQCKDTLKYEKLCYSFNEYKVSQN